MKRFFIFISTLLMVSACLSDTREGWCTTTECDTSIVKKKAFRIPARSGSRSIVKRDPEPLVCGVNAQCWTLSGDFSGEDDSVIGEYGIFYYDEVWEMYLFMPLYEDEAIPVAGTTDQYAMANWDRMVFFIQVDPDQNPEPLQCRLYGYDTENTRIYGVKGGFYRQLGKDYSSYPAVTSEERCAIIEMELYVDDQNQVVDYDLRVFDENGDYVENRKLGIGDEIDLPYWGTNDDTPGWDYGTSFELFTEVKQAPVFTYASWIPGREFPCEKCQFPLAQGEVYFRLKGERFIPDEPGSDIGAVAYTFSDKKRLAKLGEMACSDFPTLLDVLVALKVSTGFASPHPLCFKDLDNNSRTGMPDAMVLMRQLAESQ